MPLALASVAALLVWLAPAPVHAQEAVVAPFFGIHQDGHAVTGGAVGIPLGGDGGPLALAISGGVDASNNFVDPADWEYWEANVDLVLYGGNVASGGLFLMGGFNLATVSDEPATPFTPPPSSEETTVAANLGGGVGFVVGSVMPVLGVKFEVGKRAPFMIFFGLGFALGERD